MKRFVTLLAIPMLIATLLAPASAGPSQGGWSTENIEYVGSVPFESATSTGVSIQGKYMYLTSWRSLSIYDISDPVAPTQLSTVPFGTDGQSPFRFENEQVATNGKILLFSQELPNNTLYVYDVEDKTNPTLIATVAGAGGHTQSCVLNCRYSYGSTGSIIDLKDPTKPVILEQKWTELTKMQGGVHDVYETKPGFVIASGYDWAQFLDVRNPAKPKLLAQVANDNSNFIFHSGTIPGGPSGKFLIMQGEQNATVQCDENQGSFQTFDASKWKKTGTFTKIDSYVVANGTYQDGGPPVNGLGCSAHWFTTHPSFNNKTGGLVAAGYYEHGTRLLDIQPDGKIKEAGWFVPWAGSTSATYWITKDLIYAVDYTRGLDILRYTDKP